MEPIRLMLFTDTFEIGGSERFVLRLARHLPRERFALSLGAFSEAGPLRSQLPDDVPLRLFPMRGGYLKPAGLLQVARWTHILRKQEVDLLFTNHYYTNVLGSMAAHAARVPHVTGQRGRIIPYRRRDRLANMAANLAAVRVVANSHAMVNELKRDGYLPETRVTVVHNGLPAEDFAPYRAVRAATRQDLGVSPNAPLIACVARLSPEKDHRSLLTALSLLPPSTPSPVLVLAGEGPEAAALKAEAKRLNVARQVVFAGTLSDVRPLLGAADLFVLPSLTESFPNALLEAMQAGLPVIASAVGGIPEAVDDGLSGLLVPMQDAQSMAFAISRLLENPHLAARLGAQARANVAARFSLEGMVAHVADLLTEATQGGSHVRHLRRR